MIIITAASSTTMVKMPGVYSSYEGCIEEAEYITGDTLRVEALRFSYLCDAFPISPDKNSFKKKPDYKGVG